MKQLPLWTFGWDLAAQSCLNLIPFGSVMGSVLFLRPAVPWCRIEGEFGL